MKLNTASLFKKPTLVSVKPLYDFIKDTSVTPVELKIKGWGWIKIKAPYEPTWPGFNAFYSDENSNLVFLSPVNQKLEIAIYNLFGKQSQTINEITPQKYQNNIVAPENQPIRLVKLKTLSKVITPKHYLKNTELKCKYPPISKFKIGFNRFSLNMASNKVTNKIKSGYKIFLRH